MGKISKFLLIFLIIAGWVFSGWPRIWQNPPAPLDRYLAGQFPPRVQMAQAATTTIFLTDTALTVWTVPSDWNNNANTIEVIGGGGGGGDGQNSGPGGGGGGGYSKISNLTLTPGNSITIGIGAGGSRATAASGNGVDGGNTWFNAADFASCTSATVCTKAEGGKGSLGGANTAGGLGGDSANGIGTTKTSGGTGGLGCAGDGSGGGGGAGGPNGDGIGNVGGPGAGDASPGLGGGGGGGGGGSDGLISADEICGTAAEPSTSGAGGNNYLGTGGGAGVTTGAGNAGSNGGGGSGGFDGAYGAGGGYGTDWDSTHGSGGGGGGGGDGGSGGNGGAYGGGGGGGETNSAGTSGNGAQGIIVIQYTPLISTTLGSGSDPATVTVAPGSAILDSGAFTFQTGSGTDSVTALTVVLAGSGTPYSGVSEVRITDNAGSTTYFSAISGPTSNTLNFSGGTAIPVTTTQTQFKIRVTPKTHANMPAPPGGEYALSPYVSTSTFSNNPAGSDSNANTLTIDNLSSSDVTSATTTPGDAQVTVSWTNPGGDFSNVVIARATSTNSGTPAEGSSPALDSALGNGIVRYITSGTSTTDTGLTNGTTYYYKIWAKDVNGNYSTPGVEVSATPQIAAVISVAISDSTVTYGTIPANSTKSTCTSELNDAQTLTNDGNVAENFLIRGQNSANWTLAATAASDQYVHKFLNGACSTFSGGTALTTSNASFATGVAVNGTTTLNLQINTPNPSTVYTQQSVDAIITAVQQ